MNPITYAIERIIDTDIPRPILNMMYLSRLKVDRYNFATLEEQIYQHVIQKRVIKDCNLQHGTHIWVPLANCRRIEGDIYSATYQIPLSETQGKKVTSVTHLTQATGIVAASTPTVGNNSSSVWSANFVDNGRLGGLMSAEMQVVNSVSPIPMVSNALVYLVGENTVHIRETVISPMTMQLRVIVENDENFNHILPQWYMTFHELCLEAVKMHIYNNLVLEQDNVFIHSGGELNKFKDIVDSFEDAKDVYKELIEEWYGAALLNDPEGSRRWYQMHSGGGW